jgi:hypothetical protein
MAIVVAVVGNFEQRSQLTGPRRSTSWRLKELMKRSQSSRASTSCLRRNTTSRVRTSRSRRRSRRRHLSELSPKKIMTRPGRPTANRRLGPYARGKIIRKPNPTPNLLQPNRQIQRFRSTIRNRNVRRAPSSTMTSRVPSLQVLPRKRRSAEIHKELVLGVDRRNAMMMTLVRVGGAGRDAASVVPRFLGFEQG